MRVVNEFESCVDCLMYIANGIDNADYQPELVAVAEKIHARFGAQEKHLCCAGDENEEGSFSWRPCGTCGSPLGGDRYKTALLGE